MASEQKSLTGYIKTENAILLIAVGLAIGFVAGVVFSAYRTAKPVPISADNSSAPLSAQQTESLAALIQQTRENPKDLEAWTHLGHLYFDIGQPLEAIKAYEHSLTLDGSRPDVWTDLGVMYRRAGNPQKAIECFDRALALNPSHEIATFNKGVVLMHDLKDTQGALQSWEKLILLNPDAKTPNGEPIREMVEALKKNNPS